MKELELPFDDGAPSEVDALAKQMDRDLDASFLGDILGALERPAEPPASEKDAA